MFYVIYLNLLAGMLKMLGMTHELTYVCIVVSLFSLLDIL